MNLEGKEVAWRQLGASIDMLERAVNACPDDLWNRPAKEMGFWYMAYHTLWFLEFDFSPTAQEFKSPSFDVHEYELRDLPPPYEHPYSRGDLQDYLQRCRSTCKATLAALRDNDRTLRGCERVDVGLLELAIYHIRHVQHHLAQLNLLLRQETGSAPLWIRKAKDPLASHG